MGKELIGKKQMMSIIVLFIFGSSVVIGVSSEAEQDTWVSILLALAMAIPLMLVYARIVRLNPGMDISEILETVLGKVAGKVLVALMCWYALHLAALVLRDFSEFIQIAAMAETPQLPIIIMMMLVTAYMARSGIEALGRWTLVMLPIVLFVVVMTVLMALNKMHFSHIQPVLSQPIGKIAAGSFSLLTFPFAETVMMLGVAGAIKKEDSPYRIYLGALLFGALVLLVIVRDWRVLGPLVAGAGLIWPFWRIVQNNHPRSYVPRHPPGELME